MKRVNITTFVLIAYLVVMGYIGWPGNKPDANYIEYGCVLGVTFVIILLLRFLQIKRLKIRKKRQEEDKDIR